MLALRMVRVHPGQLLADGRFLRPLPPRHAAGRAGRPAACVRRGLHPLGAGPLAPGVSLLLRLLRPSRGRRQHRRSTVPSEVPATRHRASTWRKSSQTVGRAGLLSEILRHSMAPDHRGSPLPPAGDPPTAVRCESEGLRADAAKVHRQPPQGHRLIEAHSSACAAGRCRRPRALGRPLREARRRRTPGPYCAWPRPDSRRLLPGSLARLAIGVCQP